ncbi:MAG: response regulator transcription factor [Candidatus Omnitrophota bacterium]|nr:response regulator transcription factor [Candidatus Omnitrophota bacterium]
MPPKKKILLVDDEEGFLTVIRAAMEIRGFEMVTAKSAIEAGMELSLKKPDLILMDIKMPGIDGFQACAAIRKNSDTANIPIMIVSALAEDALIERARKMGIADYFVKPIDIEKLVDRIKEVLAV